MKLRGYSDRELIAVLLWLLIVVLIASLIPASWYRVAITALSSFIAGFIVRDGRRKK